MKKKLTFFLMVVYFVSSLLYASSSQKIYTVRDDVYRRVDELCRRAGVLGPSSFSPMSLNVLLIALDRIDEDSLSISAQGEYSELYSKLTEDESLFESGWFSFDADLGANLAINIASYSEYDFTNSDKSESYFDRREDVLLPYRTVSTAYSGNLQTGKFLHRRLDCLAVFSHYIRIIPEHFPVERFKGIRSGIAATVQACTRIRYSVSQCTEGSESIPGEKGFLFMKVCHHGLRPMHHRRHVESQRAVSETDAVTFFHDMKILTDPVISLDHRNCLGISHSPRFRICFADHGHER